MARDLLGEVVTTSELVQTINDGRDIDRVFAPAVLTRVTYPIAMLLQHLEDPLQTGCLCGTIPAQPDQASQRMRFG